MTVMPMMDMSSGIMDHYPILIAISVQTAVKR